MSAILSDLLGKTVTIMFTRKGRYGMRSRTGYLNKVNEEYVELNLLVGFLILEYGVVFLMFLYYSGVSP